MPPSGAGPEGGERGRATCSKRPFLALEGEGCLQRDAASGSAAIGFLSRLQQSPQEDFGLPVFCRHCTSLLNTVPNAPQAAGYRIENGHRTQAVEASRPGDNAKIEQRFIKITQK